MLPDFLQNIGRDDHGHISLGNINLGNTMAAVTADRYAKRTGKKKKIRGVQLGYESRCSAPHAFDVMEANSASVPIEHWWKRASMVKW